MKRMASWILTCALLLTLLPAGAWAAEGYAFSGGSGTAEDPYLIATVEDLQNIGDQGNTHFLQINDIDLAESDWWNENTISIGKSGSYNGGGYRILNYHSTLGGLFEWNSGVIRNVRMEHVSVYITEHPGGTKYAAALVNRGSGRVENCSVQGEVIAEIKKWTSYEKSGGLVLGGIVGSGSRITGCTLEAGSTVSASNANDGKLSGELYVGGIAGKSDGAICDCRNLGQSVFAGTAYLYSEKAAGGIVGYLDGDIAESVNYSQVEGESGAAGGIVGATSVYKGAADNEMRNCRNEGTVYGWTSSGGIVGDAFCFLAWDCVNTGDCSGNVVGGILGEGYNYVLERCWNTGDVTTTGWAGGGIVGSETVSVYPYPSFLGEIIACYNEGTISAEVIEKGYTLGGILGSASKDTRIINCFNKGTVVVKGMAGVWNIYAGGITGKIGGKKSSVQNCYSAGKVSLTDSFEYFYVGGIAGELSDELVPVSNCLWQTYKGERVPQGAVGSRSSVGIVTDCEGLSAEAFTDGTALVKLNVGSGEWYADLTNVNGGCPVLDWMCQDACVRADKEPGLYTEALSVSLTAPDAQQIFYRLGEEGEWDTYSGSIPISQSCTLQAYAQYGAGSSPVTSFDYRIASYPVSAGKKPGTYSGTIMVPLEAPAGDIFYTTDGSDPTVSETAAEGSAVVVDHSVIIRAAAEVNGVWGDVQSFAYVISPAMTAEPAGGQLDGPTDVTLSLEDGASDFSIYYTLNGTDPRENGRLYTESTKAPISSSCTLKAAACKKGGWGEVHSFQYQISQPELVISHPSGSYQEAFYLNLSCPTAGVEIYTDFSGSFQKYKSEQDISIYQNCEFRVQLRYRGQVIKTETLNYTLPEISVTPDKKPGNKTERLKVSLTCTLGGLELRYTLDGSTPAANSALYQPDQPIPINRTSTLKVAAFMPGSTQRVWVSDGFTYTLLLPEVTASPQPGTYATPFDVTLSISEESKKYDDGTFRIYYTTDGSDPTTSETAQRGSTVKVEHGLTIRAVPISRIEDYVRYGVEGTFTYQAQTYSLSVQQTANGTVSGTPAGNYEAGTAITLVAQANEGYKFMGWQVSGATPGDLSSPELTFTMPANAVSVTPVFQRVMPAAGSNGIFQGEIGQPDVNAIFISTPEQLASIGVDSRYPLNGSYILTADLDLSDYGNWTPIGGEKAPFSGTFDGQGHVIRGLTYSGGDTYVGLFGRINEEGRIKNLGLEDVSISVTGSSATYYVGGIVGQFANTYTAVARSELRNCYVTGEITADLGVKSRLWMGGMAGELASHTSDCFNLASLTGKIDTTQGDSLGLGGIAGRIPQSGTVQGYIIERCFNSGALSPSCRGSSLYAGGITGYLDSNVDLRHCYNTADIWLTPRGANSCSAFIGGIAGFCYSVVNECYNRGDIGSEWSENNAYRYMTSGGIMGQFDNCNSGTKSMEECYNTGTVVARAQDVACAGGIVGRVFKNSFYLYAKHCVVLSPEISAHKDYVLGSSGGRGPFQASVIGVDANPFSECYYQEGITTTGEGILDKKATKPVSMGDSHTQEWYEESGWNFGQVWIWDEIENDRLPYFPWQSDGLRILGYSRDSAQVYSGQRLERVVLMAASYDDSGRMLGRACLEGELLNGVNKVDLPLAQKGTQVKVFLLEPGTLKPLTNSVTIAQ
ncbi:chitobiase/beta-hexosaminidase C-terminal domain-containing protein [Flavonifractor sp. HCP28S3_F3]|uniref:chitobiase/beta-hexosaminidase C-terminal domain-containing protein n=1 Tax=Flavonifractor sp. HCP28S3_F3 TaxID=3438939 RepID=UPI003F8A551F